MNELQAIVVTFSVFWGAWGVWVCVSILRRVEKLLTPPHDDRAIKDSA